MRTETKDVVVVGSGGAGLTASVVAACEGLDVLVAEKGQCFGGTTALSGGGVWVPLSNAAIEAGINDSKASAAKYVELLVGESLEKSQLNAFLDAAPKAIDYLEIHTMVKFELQLGSPDWQPAVEGASDDGRLLVPLEYDGRQLGDYFSKLKEPLTTFNAPGGLMLDINDVAHLMNVTKSFKSFVHAMKLGIRYLLDRLNYPRGTRLTMGNALMARYLHANLDAGVTLWNRSPVLELCCENKVVTAVIVEHEGEKVRVNARKGVVLASGGFSANPDMRAKYYPFPEYHQTLIPDTNTADGLTMAMNAGAVMEQKNISNAGWNVISLLHNADGSVEKFMHLFFDRPKPGCIAVNAQGKRFCDEAAFDIVHDMHASNSVPAHFVCDHKFIKKYGLGLVKPGGFGLTKYIKAGYILTAETLEQLAEKMAVDAEGLLQTVKKMNHYAEQGHDPDFGKGSSSADLALGDPAHKPNPCLGYIRAAPYYAVKFYPGDAASTLGLKVNSQAQVLDKEGAVITGLYAAGLDMNSLWRGVPPGSGSNNTLSITFAYIAAMHIVKTQ